MCRLFTCFISLYFLSFSSSYSQKYIARGCFYGDNNNGELICQVIKRSNYNNDFDAQAIVTKIVDVVGLQPNFVLVPCSDIDNCAALVYTDGQGRLKDGYRYIIYDVKFMKNIESLAGTDWTSLSILAHEIAHHLLGHTLNNSDTATKRKEEIDADKWSGYALRLLGASLQQAGLAMNTISHPACLEEVLSDHPCKVKRLAAISEGWNKASGRFVANSNSSSITSLVKVSDVSVSTMHNVDKTVDNELKKGLSIHVKFDISNYAGKKGRVSAYFYENNGKTPLETDKRDAFTTVSGKVSVFEEFEPTYQNSTYEDFELFMPYDMLRLNPEGKYELKYTVAIGIKNDEGKYVTKSRTPFVSFSVSFN